MSSNYNENEAVFGSVGFMAQNVKGQNVETDKQTGDYKMYNFDKEGK